MSFAKGGDLFTPLSAMIQPMGSSYCSQWTGSDCLSTPHGTKVDEPIPYIAFSGFRQGQLVSTGAVYLPASSVFDPVSLSFLGSIDMLRIDARNNMDYGLPGICFAERAVTRLR